MQVYEGENTQLTGRGAWVAQSVGHPTSAQVMISWLLSLSPRWALCCQQGAHFRSSVSLSLCSLPALSLSLSNINIKKKKKQYGGKLLQGKGIKRNKNLKESREEMFH